MILRTVLCLLPLAAPLPAHAQAMGSVNCLASLRQLDNQLTVTQRKTDSHPEAGSAERCSALRVQIFIFGEAERIFGRCVPEELRGEKLAEIKSAEAKANDEIAQSCEG